MPSVHDVLEAESPAKLRILSRSPSAAAFAQGVIQHMALMAASKGVRAEAVTISAPFVEGGDLCATVRWNGAIRVGDRPPEVMRPRGTFAQFLEAENSAYAEFMRGNAALHRFLDQVAELLVNFANHRHAPLERVVLGHPFVAFDQYIRATLDLVDP